MDLPLPCSLKIGRAVVGLVGLDAALSRALAARGKPRWEVQARLFEEVAAANYIPPGREDLYRQALIREYQRLLTGGGRGDGTLEIRILGADCVSCNRLQELVIEVMAELGVAADIVQIHDPDEIGRFGLQRTPALVINGRVVSAGRLPTRAQVEKWLRASRAGRDQAPESGGPAGKPPLNR